MSTRTSLITGITGKQGGATARALQDQGFHLRGLTRKPEGEAAVALQGLGIEMVKGDLNDAASLECANLFQARNAGGLASLVGSSRNSPDRRSPRSWLGSSRNSGRSLSQSECSVHMYDS